MYNINILKKEGKQVLQACGCRHYECRFDSHSGEYFIFLASCTELDTNTRDIIYCTYMAICKRWWYIVNVPLGVSFSLHNLLGTHKFRDRELNSTPSA